MTHIDKREALVGLAAVPAAAAIEAVPAIAKEPDFQVLGSIRAGIRQVCLQNRTCWVSAVNVC